MWQRALTTLAAFTFSIAVHAAGVQTDYDTEKDFSQFHYYDWLPQSDSIDAAFSLLGADNVKDLLNYSLERQMTQASEKFPADVLVRLYIKSVEKLVDDRPRASVGIGGFDDHMGGGFSFSFPIGASDLDLPARIVIDFLDPKTQRLLWRGSVETRLSSKSVQTNQQQLQKAFDAILKKFPPHT